MFAIKNLMPRLPLHMAGLAIVLFAMSIAFFSLIVLEVHYHHFRYWSDNTGLDNNLPHPAHYFLGFLAGGFGLMYSLGLMIGLWATHYGKVTDHAHNVLAAIRISALLLLSLAIYNNAYFCSDTLELHYHGSREATRFRLGNQPRVLNEISNDQLFWDLYACILGDGRVKDSGLNPTNAVLDAAWACDRIQWEQFVLILLGINFMIEMLLVWLGSRLLSAWQHKKEKNSAKPQELKN